MADHPSLADRAVHALAEVAAMDRDVRSNDPECLVVWNLKDEAQQTLAEAFTRVARLASLAQAVRRDMRQAIEAAQRPEGE
ncbi:hypothetical protein JY452_04690 [Stenotrophomonas maltophilia]|uniref:hypothetical protein n=1 Tax=Stenotrophomonas TaxID=40323 RepID=UPI0006BEDEE1|nr:MULTISPECIES: hypothetical protein [Stenotrophomonas]KAA3603392.1 hypothetical protein D1178_02015 [Stenotrophomonas maltophilia]KOO80447.1 hypothetical protein VO93_18495 [Stenotrophomonas maltophilia]MBN5125304.1 hypothetical protein [Stenotrophomonas maltophilia]MBN5175674.1 hypothetical protein [Stenotrophomonas maltophilia]MCU1120961.1 hypothetical protein [Stenotrophomonas maltophilia]